MLPLKEFSRLRSLKTFNTPAGKLLVIMLKEYSHYVYILQSLKDNTLYVGSTNDFNKRIIEHDLKKSNFTKSRYPYKILWHCIFIDEDCKTKALKLEKYLKSGSGREFIKKFILCLKTK